MPRMPASDTRKKTAAVTATINQYMLLRDVDEEYMADKLDVDKYTFRKKMNDSGKFTVKQLILIMNILQIPEGINPFVGAVPPDEGLAYRIMSLICTKE